MRVIIAGSRSITDILDIDRAVDLSGFSPTEVICGEARGADSLGRQWAERMGIPVRSFPARWNDLDAPGAVIKAGPHGRYNAVAGHQRNQLMVDACDCAVLIYDGKSKGTLDCINRLRKAEKPFFIYKV